MTESAAVYLDHAATSPMRDEVRAGMLPYLGRQYGNASSLHAYGREARRAVEAAREKVAGLINTDPRDIVFTSGGTEANHLGIAGYLDQGTELMVSAVEHPSVLRLASKHFKVPVDGDGVVDIDAVRERLKRGALLSVMWANNETGVVQPIKKLLGECRASDAWLHTDAVQAAGKLPLDVRKVEVDLLTLSAHKLGGPQGVGALYARRETPWMSSKLGGNQERGRRAGTENVAGIVGFGIACQLAHGEMETERVRLGQLRERLEDGIRQWRCDTWINGQGSHRVPHILNVGIEGWEGEELVLGMDSEGIAVSSGAACSSGSIDASHVLLAMGQDHAKAHSGIRFSLGWNTQEADMARALNGLKKLLESRSPS